MNSKAGISGESFSVSSSGKVSSGTFSTTSTTKFLVVYKNGDKDLVTVNDNSRLCKAYLMKIKNDK